MENQSSTSTRRADQVQTEIWAPSCIAQTDTILIPPITGFSWRKPRRDTPPRKNLQ